jgi:hypothetical protein
MPPRRGSSSESERVVRIAPTDADPLASLGLYKVQVSLAGRTWFIPALEAAEWLKILLAEDLDAEEIFPGFCGPEVVAEVNRMIIDETITNEELGDAICDAIAAASGRKWWVTLRLCAFLRKGWDRIGGEMAANGVTPFGVSLSYWLDGAYATCLNVIEKGDQRQLTKFTDQLTAPLPGRAKESFDLERNQLAFKAAMGRARGR